MAAHTRLVKNKIVFTLTKLAAKKDLESLGTFYGISTCARKVTGNFAISKEVRSAGVFGKYK